MLSVSMWNRLYAVATTIAITLFHLGGCMEQNEQRNSRENNAQVTFPFSQQDFPSTIPSCARRRVMSMGTAISPNLAGCYGFFLRDDILVTSIECAEQARAVGGGENSETVIGDIGSISMTVDKGSMRDGKLVTSEHFLGTVQLRISNKHPLRSWPRLLMFLSDKPADDNSLESVFQLNSTAFAIKCEGDTPILSLLTVQKGRLLPLQFDKNSMDGSGLSQTLWEGNENVAQLKDENGEHWWIRKENLQKLRRDIERLSRDKYHAPEGALSIVQAHGVGAVLEAEYPSGNHIVECMAAYCQSWLRQKPFSGESFFDWLDFGSGASLQLEQEGCPREKLKLEKRKFFNETERQNSSVQFDLSDEGKTVRLTYTNTQQPLPTGKFDFVWGMDRRIYAVPVHPDIGHASFFRGGPVRMAGELEVGANSMLVSISASSGHYKPQEKHVKNLFLFFSRKGVERSAIIWKGYSSRDSMDNFSVLAFSRKS